jgi:hypothetical protein
MVAMVAVFAFSALAASAASAAAPEFKPICFENEAGPGAKYSTKAKCEKEGEVPNGGKWERITFTSTSGKATLETVPPGSHKVECASDTDTGEFTGHKTDTTTVRFKTCEALGFPCKSTGAAAGEIVTNVLKSELGFINKRAKTVGDALSPLTAANLAEFECAGITIVVEGSVIGSITEVNASEYTLTFTQTKGVQNPTSLEGEPEDVLFTSIAGGAFEQSGQETVATLHTSAPTVLKT